MQGTDFFADAAKQGDDEGFVALYERLAPAIYAWADCRLKGSIRKSVDADDVVQEVWWRTLDSFERFQSRGQGSFRAWVFAIATNVYRDALRRGLGTRGQRDGRLKTLPPELHAQVTSISQGLSRSDVAQELVESLAGLDPEDRKIVLYCGLEGLQIKEAAELMHAPHERIKKRWQRLRARLEEVPAWRDLLSS